MNLEYGWIRADDNSIYRNNLTVIKNFQGYDHEGINADTWGQLYTSSGAVGINSLWGSTLGTTLKGTSECIQKTWEDSNAKFNASFSKLQESFLSPFDTNYDLKLKTVAEDLFNELELLNGIAKIDKVYTKRFQENPEYDGLQDLNKVTASFQKELETNIKKFTFSVEQVREKDRALGQQSDITDAENLSAQFSSFKISGTEISHEEAASNIVSYCAKYCPDILPMEAITYAQKGEVIFNAVLSGEKTTMDDKDAECTALAWYLQSIAIEKKEGFQQGTFVVEDVHDRLYNYLVGSKECYERHSSHYKGRSSKLHKGIDIFNGKLPAHKRTLLFEKVFNPLYGDMPRTTLFIKPENYSADAKNIGKAFDTGMHTYEFVVAQYNKKYYPGSDDLPHMRKERVPSFELQEFSKLVSILERCIKDGETDELWLSQIFEGQELGPLQGNMSTKGVMACAETYGIAFMMHFLDSLGAFIRRGGVIPPGFDPVALIQMLSLYDKPYLRTGREVYIQNNTILET